MEFVLSSWTKKNKQNSSKFVLLWLRILPGTNGICFDKKNKQNSSYCDQEDPRWQDQDIYYQDWLVLLEKLAAPFPRGSSNEEWWLLPHGEKEANIVKLNQEKQRKFVKIRPTVIENCQAEPRKTNKIRQNSSYCD